MGERHLFAFSSAPGVSISMCDPDPGRRTYLDENFELQSLYPTVEAALEDPRWNTVVVATPANTHVSIGSSMTALGHPVLVEKPLALETDGIADWIELEASNSAPVMVAYPFRCHPLASALRSRVLDGVIGDPVQAVSSRGVHVETRRPNYATTYYASPSTGGGILYDILSHTFNLSEWIFGAIDTVAADAAHLVLPGVEVPDTVHTMARHGDVMVTHSIAQHHEVANFTFTVHGTRGSLQADFVTGELLQSSGPDGAWEPVATFDWSRDRWLALQAQTFLDVIGGISEAPCGLREGLDTVRSVEAAIRAARERVWIAPKDLP